jgi:hypothetical protein
MNRKIWGLSLTLATAMLAVVPAHAATIDLFDWAFNIDSTIYRSPGDYLPPDPGQLPPSINVSGFSFSNGQGSGSALGTVAVTLDAPGNHFVGSFFDYEIDEAINGFSNEIGAAQGSPAAGQSWEIDEPGYGVPGTSYTGDIFDNFLNSRPCPGSCPPDSSSFLDNMVFESGGQSLATIKGQNPVADDVAMAQGWIFTLPTDQSAVISFSISETMPSTGFYLSQTDPDPNSNITLYFQSALTVQTQPPPGTIPVPATSLLIGIGLLGLAVRRGSRR